ncbi:GNAT family N-acetyltransferase [Paenibacillus methanolicus]|uniref:Ribosomal protein S18 acetylase RimI-like enzyme n=1 Tax=Paenibacillus methanolicus TaxID=582686 RepID=A0A5S5CAY9_9BACL|nr:GNAT family N-acetyltransferase [Paenibacillus methanolicus]TYP75662.1 ribosomal protein S18 acetylase RimI-like enzyme [Paenibacillus methanolicus]
MYKPTNSIGKSKNTSFEAFHLLWDSEYFGIHAAKVILEQEVPVNEQREIMEFINGHKFDFLTIVNKHNISENNRWLGIETNAFITDVNVQYSKKLRRGSSPVDYGISISISNCVQRNNRLLEIAKKTFKHSRFFNDPWLSQQKAKDIYSQWTNNAFNQLERYFAVAELDNNSVGFLLFSIVSKQHAIIELIAVDENYKGKRVGKALIDAFESYVALRGVEYIRVGTQMDNISAGRFYVSCGYQLESCNSIFHYWPNKKLAD